MTVTVRDNPTEHRYEVFDGEDLAGYLAYKLTNEHIALTHTETDPAFRGRGLARQLVTEGLEDARRRGLTVSPFCPYVREVISQDTATYLDLVPRKDHERFGFANETPG
jgi:hypothetical protein